MNKYAHLSPKSLKPPSLALKDKQSPQTTNIPIKTIQYIHVYNYVKKDNPRIVFKKFFFSEPFYIQIKTKPGERLRTK